MLLNVFYKTLYNTAWDGMLDGWRVLLIEIEDYFLSFMQRPCVEGEMGHRDLTVMRSLGVSIFTKSTGSLVHLSLRGRFIEPCPGFMEVRLTTMYRERAKGAWPGFIEEGAASILDLFFTPDDPYALTVRIVDPPRVFPIPAGIPDATKPWKTTTRGHYKGTLGGQNIELVWVESDRQWELRSVKYSGAFQAQAMAWEGLREPTTRAMYLSLCMAYVSLPNQSQGMKAARRDALAMFKRDYEDFQDAFKLLDKRAGL